MTKYTIYSLLAVLTVSMSFISTASAQIDAKEKQDLMNTTDVAVLINALQKGTDAPEDIFRNNLACKRLAVIGNDSAIPALVKLLSNDKQNFNARFALEAMPGKAVDDALYKAATELKGANAAGVIATIGNRRNPTAIPVLKGLLEKNPEPIVKKALYAALGFIANDEATAILLAELKKGKGDNNFTVWTGLADALLDCAEAYETAGNVAKAGEIFDAVVNPEFPVFAQKAAAYHGLLVRKGASASVLVEKLQSPKQCCFSGGLKTIREFPASESDAIVKAVLGVFPKLEEVRKCLVIRALGDRTDEVSQKLVFPFLIEQGKNGSEQVKLSVLTAFAKVAALNPAGFLDFVHANNYCTAGKPYSYALTKTLVAINSPVIDEAMLKSFNEKSGTDAFVKPGNDNAVDSAKVLLNVIEQRRIKAAGPGLVKVINAAGVNDAVRDSALNALSEIVSFDNLDLLVKALNNVTDEKKVDWILRAACTRMPREDCAAAVAKMFEAAPLEEKAKLVGLLKQIGGKTAVACIAKACENAETVDMASQILGQWNTPDDIEDVAAVCLKLAKESQQNKYRVRAIRSYIRIPRQFNMPTDKRIAMCKTAFETATRPEDKALIFDVLARLTEVAGVQAAMSYVNDSAFTTRACTTAVAIAEKINLAKPSGNVNKDHENARIAAVAQVTEAMNQVVRNSGDTALKDRAKKVMERLK